MKKLLSIIVPYYNSMPYFPAMLDSLEPQITDEIEVIFVNDGSTDESAEQLARFAENKNVRSISVPHSGVSAARNAGIAEAQGDYLWYMDSDDMLCEGIVDVILDHIRFYKGEPDMFFGDLLALEDDDPDDLKKVHFSFDQYLGKTNRFSDPFYHFFEEIKTCSMLGSSIFKRDFIMKNGIVFNEKVVLSETALYRIDVLLRNPCTAFINQPLYVFRIHDEAHPSLRQKKPTQKQSLLLIQEYEKIFFYFLNEYSLKKSKQNMIFMFSEILYGSLILYLYIKNDCDLSQDSGIDKIQLDSMIISENLLSLVTFQDVIQNLPPEWEGK